MTSKRVLHSFSMLQETNLCVPGTDTISESCIFPFLFVITVSHQICCRRVHTEYFAFFFFVFGLIISQLLIRFSRKKGTSKIT
jgi:hypothetical protein